MTTKTLSLLLGAGMFFLLPAARAAADDTEAVTVDPDTAAVIAGGLRYLAHEQQANGSWSNAIGRNGYPVAMTGYALMAMMSAGNLPEEGPYKQNVAAGMRYLLEEVQPPGLFRDVDKGKYMYSHGIGTLALAEMYGETQSPVLRERLTQLVQQIVAGQSQAGGWRYEPNARDSDVSVTVPQLAALRAAQNAGIAVPQGTIDRALDFLRLCADDNSGEFYYQPGRQPGFACTAAAIYSLQLCGEYDDPRVKRGSDFLVAQNERQGQWWAYGNYYAAPAQYMIGGATWRQWYPQIRDELMKNVTRQGGEAFWNDRHSQGLGPVYETAVFLTILALPYHYLPLYQR